LEILGEYKNEQKRGGIRRKILERPREIVKPKITVFKTDIPGPSVGVKKPWKMSAGSDFPNSERGSNRPFRFDKSDPVWRLIQRPPLFKIWRL